MNREEDGRYYQRRAQKERVRAERSEDCAVKAVHQTLAREYERRAENSVGAQ